LAAALVAALFERAAQWSVVTLLAICGLTHRESCFDIAIITNCSAAASRLLTLLAGKSVP
jgi:hypothetical protein